MLYWDNGKENGNYSLGLRDKSQVGARVLGLRGLGFRVLGVYRV